MTEPIPIQPDDLLARLAQTYAVRADAWADEEEAKAGLRTASGDIAQAAECEGAAAAYRQMAKDLRQIGDA